MADRSGVAYLQVRPHPRYSGQLRVVKVTQRRPEVIEPGCVVIKLRLQVPAAAFEPLQPEATVVVPESLTQHPVAVEAVDPS